MLSFRKYLLIIYCVPDPVGCPEETAEDKIHG